MALQHNGLGLGLDRFTSFPALVGAALLVSRRTSTDALPEAAEDTGRPRMGRPSGLRLFAAGSVVAVLAGLSAIGVSTHGCDGPRGPAVAAASGVPVQVSLGEFAIKPSSIAVTPGADLVLDVRNTGRMHHDLRLDGTRGTRMLAPGEEQVVDFGAVQHDEQAWCTVSGQKEAGMELAICIAAAGHNGSIATGRSESGQAMPGMAGMPGMMAGATPAPQWRPYDPTLHPVPAESD